MTNTGMFFRMLFSAVFRRRSRAVMAVVASLVGAATLFCLAMICLAVPQQMNEEMRAYGANLIVTPTESTNADGKAGIDKAMVQHTTEMVKAKGSAKYATYRYENVRVNASPYVMAGVNAAQVKNLNHHWVVDGSWPTDGKVLVGRDIADAIGLRIGSAITIGYRASDNASTNGTSSNSSIDQQTKDGRVSSDIMDTSGTEFRVAGIVDTGGSEDSIIYATNADVNKLTGITRGVDVIEYSAGASDLAGLVSSINDMTSMHVKAQQVTKITASDTRIITMLQTLFWIVSLVVLVLTLVGVGTTISSIVSQRRNEIGLRKALGASSRAIGTEFYIESSLYGLIGGLIGTAIGYGLASWLCVAVFERSIVFNWWLALISVLFSALVAIVASIPPVHRATRIDPAVVLREDERKRHVMLLELDHISKIYGDLRAVDDLNLTVPEGEWLAIVGSSGSGKTTLMNMIGCMDTPSKGSVKLEGRKLEDLNATQLADVRKNLIGLVFQKFYLVPHLTAVENVMVAQYYHSVVDEKQAMEALEKVGLKDRAHHLPGQLSGGEQQRVCVARALINDPKLILADEPTGNLDEKNEKIVLDLFRKLHEQGTTIIVVTHDALVASCAQREIMLNHGVLVGEKWNDEDARKAYEAAGGKPASTGAQVEGAQNGETAIGFTDPTKAAKTGGEE